MWQPCPSWNKEFNVDNYNSGEFKTIDGIDMSSTTRQLWVWLHASASSEGYDALKFACQKEVNIMFMSIILRSIGLLFVTLWSSGDIRGVRWSVGVGFGEKLTPN